MSLLLAVAIGIAAGLTVGEHFLVELVAGQSRGPLVDGLVGVVGAIGGRIAHGIVFFLLGLARIPSLGLFGVLLASAGGAYAALWATYTYGFDALLT